MFKDEVTSRYKVVAYDKLISKMIEDAEKELAICDAALEKAQKEYEKLIDIEDTSVEKLQAMEKKIEELEKERNDAARDYERAKETTVDDLKAEKRYQDWKDSR